ERRDERRPPCGAELEPRAARRDRESVCPAVDRDGPAVRPEAVRNVAQHVADGHYGPERGYGVRPLEQREIARCERVARAQPDEHAVAALSPSDQHSSAAPAPTTPAAAAARARGRVEGDCVAGRPGHLRAQPCGPLRRVAAGGTSHGERAQRESAAAQGEDTPRSARAASDGRVWGASASTRSAGRGRGVRCLRSTHTSTIHPAAARLDRAARSTSKFRVIDFVPTRPTYAATFSRSS